MANLVSNAEKKRFELQKKLAARKEADGSETVSAMTEDEKRKLVEERLAQAQAEDARRAKKEETWDPNAKVFKGAIGDDTVKAAPVKVCKALNLVSNWSRGPNGASV